MRMTGETIPLLVGAGLGVGVLAGVVSGVCFLLANGLGWSRRVHRGAVLKIEGSPDNSCAACGGNSNAECSSCALPVCNSCVDDDQSAVRCRPCTNDRLVFTSSLTRSNSFLHLLKETFTFRSPTNENLNQFKVARTPVSVEVPAATATGAGGLEEGRQIRDFLQHLAEKLTGGSLDDVSVTRMYQNPEYDRMFRSYHAPVCSAISSLSVALRSSSRNLPVTNMESASSAHSRLQQLIQRIIEEALHLPAFLDYSGSLRESNGKLPEFNPKTYEDLLATAILNKVIDRYQHDPKRSTGASSSGVHSGSSSPGCDEAPLGRAARRRGRPRTSVRESTGLDRSSPEPASHDDYANSDSSGRASAPLKTAFLKNEFSSDDDDVSDSLYKDPVEAALSTINFQNKTRVAFPEYGGDIIELEGVPTSKIFVNEDIIVDTNEALNNNTDIYTNNNSWEENWLFQKKKIKNTQSVSVPMLVPNSNTECRALIGDRDAEDTTDLSEAGSESDEKSDESNDIKKVLINSKTIIGGKNPILTLIDQDINENEIKISENKRTTEIDETSDIILKPDVKETNNNICTVEAKQSSILEYSERQSSVNKENGEVIDILSVNDCEINKLNNLKTGNGDLVSHVDNRDLLCNWSETLVNKEKELGIEESTLHNQNKTSDLLNLSCDNNSDNICDKSFSECKEESKIINSKNISSLEAADLIKIGDSENKSDSNEINMSNNDKMSALHYILDDINEDIETMSPPNSIDYISKSHDAQQAKVEEIKTDSELLVLNERIQNGDVQEINKENLEIITRETNNNDILTRDTVDEDIRDVDNNQIETETHDICTLDIKANNATFTIISNNESKVMLKEVQENVKETNQNNNSYNVEEVHEVEIKLIKTIDEDVQKGEVTSSKEKLRSKENIHLDDASIQNIASQVDEIINQAIKDNAITKAKDNENYSNSTPDVSIIDIANSGSVPDYITNKNIIGNVTQAEIFIDDTIEESIQIIETQVEKTSETENVQRLIEIVLVTQKPEITELVSNQNDIHTIKTREFVEDYPPVCGKPISAETGNEIRIETVNDLIESLQRDEVDTSLPSIEVEPNTFIAKDVNETANLDVEDKQDVDGHQRDSEYLETITVPVQRHMDSLKRQHHIREQDNAKPDSPPRSPLKKEMPTEEFIPEVSLDIAKMDGQQNNIISEGASGISKPFGSIAEREHKKWLNAVPMENNPYSPEAIERRLSKQNKLSLYDIVPKTPNPSLDDGDEEIKPKTKTLQEVFKEDTTGFKRYGRDYYINQSKSATGYKELQQTRKFSQDSSQEHDDVKTDRRFVRSSSEAPTATWRKTGHDDSQDMIKMERSQSQIEVYSPTNSKRFDGLYEAVPATSEPDLYSATPVVIGNEDHTYKEITYDYTLSDVTDSTVHNTTNGSTAQSDMLDVSDCISSPDDSMLVYNIQTGKILSSENNKLIDPEENITNDNLVEEDYIEDKITSSMLNNINKSWKSTGDVYLAAIEQKNKEKGKVIEEDINLPSVKDLRRKFVTESKEETTTPEIKPKRKISRDFPNAAITKTYSNSQTNLRQPLHMHSLTARSIPKEFRDELKLSMPVQANIHPGGSKEIPEGAGDPIKEGKKDRPESPQPEPGSLKNKLAFFEKLNQK